MINNKTIKNINALLLNNPIKSIVIIGVLYRVTIFFIFYTNITMFPDSDGYTELAQCIANFNLTAYSGLRSLGYPLLIAFMNQNLYFVVFAQFCMGIFSMILWYKTLLNFNFQINYSLCLSLFIGSFLNVFFFETSILVETFALFIVSIIIYLFSKDFFEKTLIINYLFLSFLFGFLVLIKPFYAYLPFIFGLFLLLKKCSIKRIIYCGLLVSCSLIAYFGWCYVNKVNTGYFAPTSYYGLTNAQTCVYFAEKTPKEWNWISKPYVKYREKAIAENKDVSMSIWFAYEDGAFDKYNLTFQELSQQLGKFAKVAIKQNPDEYFYQVVCRSWFDFWKPAIYWNYESFNFLHANWMFLGIWYIQYIILAIFELVFIFLIFPYAVFSFFKTKKTSNLLVLTTTVFLSSVLQAIVTYGTNDRYSFPFEFIIIISVFMFFKEKGYFAKHPNISLQ